MRPGTAVLALLGPCILALLGPCILALHPDLIRNAYPRNSLLVLSPEIYSSGETLRWLWEANWAVTDEYPLRLTGQ